MADYFIYNNDGILPEYNPGIPGYGQRGSRGDTGSAGASVYYSSFDLSNPANYDLANKYVKANKSLSNNLSQDNFNEYCANDIIIDCTGSLYTLMQTDDGLAITTFTANNTSSVYALQMEHFTKLDIYCSTSFLKSSVNRWKVLNPNGVETVMANPDDVEDDTIYMYLNTPHKIRYRNKIEGDIYGNYVKFVLSHDDLVNESDYTYTFVLCLPNGQTFKSFSSIASCSMFIENRFIYGCFDVKSWNNPMKIDDESLYGVANLSSENVKDYSNLFNCIEFNGVHHKYQKPENPDSTEHAKPMVDSSLNNEWSKDTTILCSEFIKYNCTGYVELCNKATGKTYRIDMNDIFLTKAEDGTTEQHTTTNIESVKDSLIWKLHKYPARAWIANESNSYDMDSFVPFVVDSTETEDEHEVKCFFVSNRNVEDPEHKGAVESYINPNAAEFHDFEDWESWKWNDSSAGNRVIRLYFRSLKSFSLSLKYNSGKATTDEEGNYRHGAYPTTMVYIGAPDCNLIQYGNRDEINKQIEVDELTGLTGIIKGCSDAGIYYMNKFIAPGIELSKSDSYTMEAGLTDYTIHPSTYNIDPSKYHFIEIGLVTFKDKNGVETHMNIPKSDTVESEQAIPKYKVFEDALNYQHELLPFSTPETDFNGDKISGEFDLSIYVYAIADADAMSEPSQGEEQVPYDPANYVHKDTI